MRVTGLDHLQHYIRIVPHEARRPDECVASMAELITRESCIDVPPNYANSQAYLESQHPDADTWYELYSMSFGVLGAAFVSHNGQTARVAEMAIRSDVQRRRLGSMLVRHIAEAAAEFGETSIFIPATPPEFAESLGMQVAQDADIAETNIGQLLSPPD